MYMSWNVQVSHYIIILVTLIRSVISKDVCVCVNRCVMLGF